MMTGQQERGLVFLIIVGLLAGGLVLLWPKPERNSALRARPILIRNAEVIAPKFIVAKKVDVNTASAQELETLPGIGPALAARIVEYRTTHGSFRSLDDLTSVKGIGPSTVDRLREAATAGD